MKEIQIKQLFVHRVNPVKDKEEHTAELSFLIVLRKICIIAKQTPFPCVFASVDSPLNVNVLILVMLRVAFIVFNLVALSSFTVLPVSFRSCVL